MTVPFAFANLSGNIALAKLDSNFNTPITIGNTSVLLGNTVTTLNNLTLANVTITSGTSNVTNVNVTNVTVTNLTATLANVTTLNASSASITSANIGTLALTNPLSVPNGGTGQVTFPANSVLVGNGTGGIATVAPGNVGNVLTSIGGAWVSNVAMSGAAAGANTQVQYNNSGALAGSANLVFDGTNVGIGTSSPSLKLDVNGSAKFAGNYVSFNDNGYIRTDAANILRFQPGSGGYQFRDQYNQNNLAVLDASGRLGIGNNTITAPLSFADSAGTSGTANKISLYQTGGDAIYGFGLSAGQLDYVTGGAHVFYSRSGGASTERVRIDSSGNLGIGTSSPSGKLTVTGGRTLLTTSAGDSYVLYLNNPSFANGVLLGNPANDTLGFFNSSGIEQMRVDASGNLLVGTTSAGGGSNVKGATINNVGQIAVERDGGIAGVFNRFSSDGQLIIFRRQGTTVGDISVTTVLTTYNTTSDYRLKTVIGAVANSGSRIDALQPVEYTWNADGSRTRGFLAHQFQEVYASSVTGIKDAVDDEGKPVYQAMQASTPEVMADLVAEIQSLRVRIAQLEAK